MRNLTREEFIDRIETVNKARKIFGPLTNNNVSKAFEAYQLILAHEQREIMLNSKQHGGSRRKRFDDYERPKCPDCGKNMALQEVNTGPQNQVEDKTAKTYWCCEDVLYCGYMGEYSTLTANEWANKLHKKVK